MKTPIYDFVKEYSKRDALRLHMPGHKGSGPLGFERYDITEIAGADCLYSATGIIKESEDSLTSIFDTGLSVYSCEGSSLCVRAMLYLAQLNSGARGGYALSGRNAHSSFITASALLGFDVKWLYPNSKESYLSCTISPEMLENALRSVRKKPFCVYITSPDYLGNIADIKGLSQVCDKFNIPLLVDNAHGAYLKFLPNDLHPITQGATMCCDSAHKTLPVLTGGAYLHISKKAPHVFKNQCKEALKLFGSTSPSYLILSSLDLCNRYLTDGYSDALATFTAELDKVKGRLKAYGFDILGTEPLKMTIKATTYGYMGTELACELEKRGVVCELCDKDLVVLMLSLENGFNTLKKIERCFYDIDRREPIRHRIPSVTPPQVSMSIRDAFFAKKCLLPLKECEGKIASGINTTCPPAVSILVPGEVIDKSAIKALKYYGYKDIYVIDK
ncbi:MAG: amino acid decarboxylase [Clostridia bacterium]|nr:amino acid decarboxylase [Clostridia bacterium]